MEPLTMRCADCEWYSTSLKAAQEHQFTGHRVTFRGRVQAPIRAPWGLTLEDVQPISARREKEPA